jgi:hypothetical protein
VTIAQVAAKLVAVIGGLRPAPFPLNDSPFVEGQPPHPQQGQTTHPMLRTWAPFVAAAKVVRRFEVQFGDRVDLGVLHHQATLCDVPVRATVAYPGQPTLYGLTTLRELEAMIAADAQLVRDALFGPTGLLGPGHLANLRPTIRTLERSGPVWFQDIDATARFYT